MEFLNNEKFKIVLVIFIIVIGIILFKIYMNNDVDEFVIDNNIENEIKIEENKKETEKQIVIHVAGEVNNPGIVILKEGNRVIDAINAAGGKTSEADYTNINLASVLEDGQKVYIPNIKEKDEINNKNEEKNNGKININKANVQELEGLPGIGNSIARSIVEYRNENGSFKSKEDIKKVTGRGDQKYEKIQKYIEI